MPNITVELFKGRSLAQKKAFVEAVTRAAEEHLSAGRDSVRIRFDEMDHDDLAQGGRYPKVQSDRA